MRSSMSEMSMLLPDDQKTEIHAPLKSNVSDVAVEIESSADSETATKRRSVGIVAAAGVGALSIGYLIWYFCFHRQEMTETAVRYHLEGSYVPNALRANQTGPFLYFNLLCQLMNAAQLNITEMNVTRPNTVWHCSSTGHYPLNAFSSVDQFAAVSLAMTNGYSMNGAASMLLSAVRSGICAAQSGAQAGEVFFQQKLETQLPSTTALWREYCMLNAQRIRTLANGMAIFPSNIVLSLDNVVKEASAVYNVLMVMSWVAGIAAMISLAFLCSREKKVSIASNPNNLLTAESLRDHQAQFSSHEKKVDGWEVSSQLSETSTKVGRIN